MTEKKICRLCLSHPTVGYSILDDDIASMVESLTSIKITQDDLFPTVSCSKCLLDLKWAFRIQQNIIKSNDKLLEMMLTKTNVKMEAEVIVDSPIQIKTEVLEESDSNTESVTEINVIECNTTSSVSSPKTNCMICDMRVENNKLTSHIQEHFHCQQKCDFCGKICDNIKSYRQHLLSNHELVSHKCHKCGLIFQYKSLFDLHTKNVHFKDMAQAQRSDDPYFDSETTSNDKDFEQAPKEIKEKIYKLGIRSKGAINLLLKKNSQSSKSETAPKAPNPANAKKKCYICNAMISSSNLKKHIMNHSSGPQICEICGATLRSFESLRGHLFYSHKSRSYTCDECGKVYSKKYPFELHKKKEHTGEKSHVCDTCGKSFFTFYYLNKHIKMTHLKLRPYVCKYCNRGFSSRFALRTHERQHTNEAPYKCEVCGEGFRQNVSLRAHRKSKHNIIEPKNCICKICGKAFGCDQAIKSHMRLH